jgi:hypothetical protein
LRGFAEPVTYLCRSKCLFKPLDVGRLWGFCLPRLNADGAGYKAVDVLEDGRLNLSEGLRLEPPDQLGLDRLEEGEEDQKTVQWTVFPT